METQLDWDFFNQFMATDFSVLPTSAQQQQEIDFDFLFSSPSNPANVDLNLNFDVPLDQAPVAGPSSETEVDAMIAGLAGFGSPTAGGSQAALNDAPFYEQYGDFGASTGNMAMPTDLFNLPNDAFNLDNASLPTLVAPAQDDTPPSSTGLPTPTRADHVPVLKSPFQLQPTQAVRHSPEQGLALPTVYQAAPQPEASSSRRVTRASASTAVEPTPQGGRTSHKPSYASHRSTLPYSKPAPSTSTSRPKRSKKDIQDDDLLRGWACPYSAHPGSAERCNVLLGTAHEVPRHLMKHLIEEEDQLRLHPHMDRSTLVFGGAPAHRGKCRYCGCEFSRYDAWERHVRRKMANMSQPCSKPKGRHGQHPELRTVHTGGAAEVLARVQVLGDKKTIVQVEEVYSYWSGRYRMKKGRGGKERMPQWLTQEEEGFRGRIDAWTPWTEEMERANAIIHEDWEILK